MTNAEAEPQSVEINSQAIDEAIVIRQVTDRHQFVSVTREQLTKAVSTQADFDYALARFSNLHKILNPPDGTVSNRLAQERADATALNWFDLFIDNLADGNQRASWKEFAENSVVVTVKQRKPNRITQTVGNAALHGL